MPVLHTLRDDAQPGLDPGAATDTQAQRQRKTLDDRIGDGVRNALQRCHRQLSDAAATAEIIGKPGPPHGAGKPARDRADSGAGDVGPGDPVALGRRGARASAAGAEEERKAIFRSFSAG